MTIKIGDSVTVYDKLWFVNNVKVADEVEKELPDIGRAMKHLNMTTLLVLEGSAQPLDLMIMRIHGQPKFTTVLVDKTGNFHDPDTVLPSTLESLVHTR